jgi:hypothetical protein
LRIVACHAMRNSLSRFIKRGRGTLLGLTRNAPSGPVRWCEHLTSPCHQQAEEGLDMTTKRSAYNSKLYSDVNDALALAVLVALSTLIMLLA